MSNGEVFAMLFISLCGLLALCVLLLLIALAVDDAATALAEWWLKRTRLKITKGAARRYRVGEDVLFYSKGERHER